MLSCQASFPEQFKQTADQRPVGGSRDRVQAVSSGGSMWALRNLYSIFLLQDANWGCWFEVLQPYRLLFQQFNDLRNFLDLCPHPWIRMSECFNNLMFSSGSSLLSRSFSFLGSVTPSHQYIYPECVHSWHAPNQSGTGPAWCGRRAHHSFMDSRWEDRMTPERPRKCPCPHPRFINKHTGHIGGDAVRLNHVAERPPIGRSETLAEQILLPHFCTVGKYLIDCRLCVCFVCVLKPVFSP